MDKSLLPQHAHSLPVICSPALAAAIGARNSRDAVAHPSGGTALSKKTKFSLNADTRNPEGAMRARRYVDQLASTAPTRSAAIGGAASRKHAGATAAVADGITPGQQGVPAARPFHLSPAESYVVTQREVNAERWRSCLLRHEADLRELVVTNSTSLGEEPPRTSRIVKVLKIFDAVCRTSAEHSSNLAEMLRLFRIEFCRAIFSSMTCLDDDEDNVGEEGGNDPFGGERGTDVDETGRRKWSCVPYKVLADPDIMERVSAEEVTTYFDQVDSLVRENALLSSEVAVGNSQSRMVELTNEIDSLKERIQLYENEVSRLSRQSDQVLDQCNRAREELANAKQEHESKMASNERELQALNVENKDLQLQLFRLRKQVAGGKSALLKDAYRQMKMDKMQLQTTLFSEGDERIAILVMLSQLESRVNEALDRYDNDFMLAPPITHTDLRSKMGETVTVLLEEMHLCEQNYRRLVPKREREPTSEETDETDGYVAILFDQKIYENLLTREAIRQRLQHGAQQLEQHDPGAGSVTDAGSGFTPSRNQQGSLSAEGEGVSVGVFSKEPFSFADAEDALRQPDSTPEESRTGVAQDALRDEARPGSKPSGTFLKSSFAQSWGDKPRGPSEANTSAIMTPPQPRASAGKPISAQAASPLRPGTRGSPRVDAAAAQQSLEELMFLKRADWVERIFSSSPQEVLVRNLRVPLVRQAAGRQLLPDELMPRLLRRPLFDLSSKKFLSSIDVLFGQDPLQLQRLCTISYVDPAIPIQVPERAAFMKIKYRSSYAPRTTKGVLTLPASTHDDHRRSRASTAIDGGDTQRAKVRSDADEAEPNNSFFMTATGEVARMSNLQTQTQTQTQPRAGARKSIRPGSIVAPLDNEAEPANSTGSAHVRSDELSDGSFVKRLKDWGAKTDYTEESSSGRHNNANVVGGGRMSGSASIATATVTVVGRDGRIAGSGAAGNPNGGGGGRAVDDSDDIFNVNENLRVFRELTNPALMKSGKWDQQKAGATSSTTATTVAFQRLNPLSPNRGPEWSLYKALFGSFRSLTPRMIEVTTIDHILMSACERHFTRMEYRYQSCLKEATARATNSQMSLAMAERFFRESFTLPDFQEAVVDELEARYCFPELVAKTFYEILCYLDAMACKDDLLALYLNVIRGFQPPTHLHYVSYMLFHLSYCWPASSPTEEISRDDALTVLRYLYRNSESIVHVDIHEVLRDYQMTTRSSPLTFVSMRKFMATAMMHQEESLLLYLNGLFSCHSECRSLDQLTYENYEEVVGKHWQANVEQKSVARFLGAGLGLDRGPLLSVRDLVGVAASEWCSNLWR